MIEATAPSMEHTTELQDISLFFVFFFFFSILPLAFSLTLFPFFLYTIVSPSQASGPKTRTRNRFLYLYFTDSLYFFHLNISLRDVLEVLFEQLIDVSLPTDIRGWQAARRMERLFRKWNKAEKKCWSHQKRQTWFSPIMSI